MKSVVQPNISWLMLLYIFGILLSCAMEDNKTKTKNYSVKQLQNDFIGLWKNPQKYVEFQLNAEKTSQPDAGGLYELLPYYQKINPLGEKTNYAIQWCAFENKWQLIEVNPLGLFASLNNEVSTIATLLEGDHFSRRTIADIKAYTTYEQMKSVIKTVGKQNKELKMKMIKMENEIAFVQTENEKLKTSVQEKYEKFKKLKVYAQKANEANELKTEEYKKIFEEYQQNLEAMELLKSNSKEKEIQINSKNESISALGRQIGCLSYQLSLSKEHEQQSKGLEKDVERQKAEIKQKNEILNACEHKVHNLEVLLIKKDEEIQTQRRKTRELQDEKQALIKMMNVAEIIELSDENEKKNRAVHDFKTIKEKIKSIKTTSLPSTGVKKAYDGICDDDHGICDDELKAEKNLQNTFLKEIKDQIRDNFEVPEEKNEQNEHVFNMRSLLQVKNERISELELELEVQCIQIYTLQNKLIQQEKRINDFVNFMREHENIHMEEFINSAKEFILKKENANID